MRSFATFQQDFLVLRSGLDAFGYSNFKLQSCSLKQW